MKSEPKVEEERSPSPPFPVSPPTTIAQLKTKPTNELAAALSNAPKEMERKPLNGEVVHQKPVKNSVNFSDMMPSGSLSKLSTQGSQTTGESV